MPALLPSRRGQQKVLTPDWVIDLRREVARDAYDKKSNPGGIVDLGSAGNLLMSGALQKWTRSHETADDRNNCRPPAVGTECRREDAHTSNVLYLQTSSTTTRSNPPSCPPPPPSS